MKLLLLICLFLIPFLAQAEVKSASISFSMDLTSNCETLEKAVAELNSGLASFNIDRQIKILRCYRKKGLVRNNFNTDITWTGGINRCDGTIVGSDFYKFLQINDDSQVKKIILVKLGFSPVSIKNYSYNYMITLCQLYLNE